MSKLCNDSKTQNGNNIKQPRITSEAEAIFGFGGGNGGITKDGAEISGSWLPTNKQVIGCFTFHRQEGTSKPPTQQKELAKIVLEKVITFLSQRKHSHGISKKRL